ncbi:hypothetical protein PHYSODRAFT_295031 [Phytophthora sojae]|uniref:Uncharacterized protein n=1 Tax=Phytophthora sojae (strain P6497) TaxID=1094619 RepID=G4YJN4_PHYSP|nr:hypothetical protein PHYSODRAFT_295031 [Phytophthora sojae]EGZ30146.1 hypothetical protein PHYSODRAFT_295031 [Phytophthora sojae]|eukprot:XP_009517421.1 hypothetical protein PHYSODRAFT_295031 [Phytophthora sojae]
MAGAREKRRTARILRGETTMWKAIWTELKAIHSKEGAQALSAACVAKAPEEDCQVDGACVLVPQASPPRATAGQAATPLPDAAGETATPPPDAASDAASPALTTLALAAANQGTPAPRQRSAPAKRSRGRASLDSDDDDAEEAEYHLVPPTSRVLRPRRSADASYSGTSLFGSSDEEHGAVDNAADIDYDAAADQSEVCSIMSSDSEDDLNQVEDDDDPDDFGGLDYGDEPMEDDLVDEDESDVDERGCDDLAEEDEVEDEDPNYLAAISERHFAEKFLESLGGAEKVLAGDVVGKALENLRAHVTSGWSEPINPDVYEHLQAP